MQPPRLPSLRVDDPVDIGQAIAQTDLILFGTTLATGGHAMPFFRALVEGKQRPDGAPGTLRDKGGVRVGDEPAVMGLRVGLVA